MLRLFVLLLLLVNGFYLAWGEGWLRSFGYGPTQQREPQRVAQQILPGAIHRLSVSEMKQVDAQVQADLAPKECLQAGPFDDAQVATLRAVLERDWSAQSWQFDSVTLPAHWIVYMGKFANDEALAKKRGELAAINITPHGVTNPALQLGISLGGFDTEAAANVELARLSGRGLRTAKVVQDRAETTGNMLRLPAVTPAMKPQLADLKASLGDKPLSACRER